MVPSMVMQAKGRCLSIVLGGIFCAILWLCGLFACPQTAFAWLDDVTDSYPASQEIEISGNVLTGADIPEGNYSSTISCSSYMCKFTDVTVTSVGGELWVTFTLSKGYDALFLGTAEEAAACSAEHGSDYSPYYTSGSVGDYVYRQFSLPVPALNYEITLATYSGGTKGTDKGLWYTRTIVCNSSAEIDLAVETGEGPGASDGGSGDSEPDDPGEQEDPGTTDDPGEQEDQGTADDSGAQEDSGTADDLDDGDDNDNDNGNDKSSSGSKSDSKSGKSNSPSSAGNTSSTPGAATPSESDDESGQDSQANAKSGGSAKKASKSKAKIGTPLSFVSSDVEFEPEMKSTAELDPEKIEDTTSRKAAMVGGIALFDLVLAGAFLVGLRHTRPRRFPRV